MRRRWPTTRAFSRLQQLADGSDSAVNGLDLIFGNNFITGSIHGFKFEDIDADGIWDQANPKTKLGAEPGLGGIVIELHDSKGNVPLLANGKICPHADDRRRRSEHALGGEEG